MDLKWSVVEEQNLQKFYGQVNYKRLYEVIPGRSQKAIASHAWKMGLKGNIHKTRPLSRKYDVNKNYFNIPTLENSYWAGFIAADGCLYEKSNSLQIELQYSDKERLEKLIQSIQYTGTYSVTNKSNRKYVKLSVNGVPEYFTYLKKHFNILPRKTYNLIGPNIFDEKLILAYIAGYIDGDGSILTIPSGKNKNEILVIEITGRKEFLIWVKNFIDKTLPVGKNLMVSNVREINNIYARYKTSCNRAKILYERIKSLNLPLMERKWGGNLVYL